MMSKHGIAEKIQAALMDSADVVAVYLFGSVARGLSHALSDVDVAVLLGGDLTEAEMFARVLEIGVRLDGALRPAVDVVALNSAPLALCFQVLKYGELVVDNDPTQRCEFVMRALARYYDAKPYLDYHNSRLLSKISEEGLGGGYHGNRDALAEARRVSARLAAASGRPTG